jgi:hypothetical protein
MQKTLEKNGSREAKIAQALDAEIAQIVETVRETVDEMAVLEEKVRMAKDRLRILLVQRGDNWKDEDGYARLMSDSVRTSYDTRSLDELIIGDPLRHGWLKDYRKEFTVRGGVQVK